MPLLPYQDVDYPIIWKGRWIMLFSAFSSHLIPSSLLFWLIWGSYREEVDVDVTKKGRTGTHAGVGYQTDTRINRVSVLEKLPSTRIWYLDPHVISEIKASWPEFLPLFFPHRRMLYLCHRENLIFSVTFLSNHWIQMVKAFYCTGKAIAHIGTWDQLTT